MIASVDTLEIQEVMHVLERPARYDRENPHIGAIVDHTGQSSTANRSGAPSGRPPPIRSWLRWSCRACRARKYCAWQRIAAAAWLKAEARQSAARRTAVRQRMVFAPRSFRNLAAPLSPECDQTRKTLSTRPSPKYAHCPPGESLGAKIELPAKKRRAPSTGSLRAAHLRGHGGEGSLCDGLRLNLDPDWRHRCSPGQLTKGKCTDRTGAAWAYGSRKGQSL